MRSPFGELLRRMRLDRGLKLIDLSNILEVTPAFLSAVETGKKSVPLTLINKLQKAWELSEEAVLNLRQNAEDSSENLSISRIPLEERRFVTGFARTLPELRDLSEDSQREKMEEFVSELLKQINKRKV